MFLSAPSPPTFDIVDVGDTYVNVTWEPSTTGNPGSVFYVQYRPRGKHQSDFLTQPPSEELFSKMRTFSMESYNV